MLILLNLRFKNAVRCTLILIPLWRLLRRGSPLPIPNREVKPASADGTWPKARESMSMPILRKASQQCGAFFFALLF